MKKSEFARYLALFVFWGTSILLDFIDGSFWFLPVQAAFFVYCGYFVIKGFEECL